MAAEVKTPPFSSAVHWENPQGSGWRRKRLKVTAQAFAPSCRRDLRMSLSHRNAYLGVFGSAALEKSPLVNPPPIKISK